MATLVQEGSRCFSPLLYLLASSYYVPRISYFSTFEITKNTLKRNKIIIMNIIIITKKMKRMI